MRRGWSINSLRARLKIGKPSPKLFLLVDWVDNLIENLISAWWFAFFWILFSRLFFKFWHEKIDYLLIFSFDTTSIISHIQRELQLSTTSNRYCLSVYSKKSSIYQTSLEEKKGNVKLSCNRKHRPNPNCQFLCKQWWLGYAEVVSLSTSRFNSKSQFPIELHLTTMHTCTAYCMCFY